MTTKYLSILFSQLQFIVILWTRRLVIDEKVATNLRRIIIKLMYLIAAIKSNLPCNINCQKEQSTHINHIMVHCYFREVFGRNKEREKKNNIYAYSR